MVGTPSASASTGTRPKASGSRASEQDDVACGRHDVTQVAAVAGEGDVRDQAHRCDLRLQLDQEVPRALSACHRR
jgi:hypothetical protein